MSRFGRNASAQITAAAAAAILLLGCAARLYASGLKRLASIELPGPSGLRFDYLTIDYDDHYLFVAHLGPGILYVIDLRASKVVKTIDDLPGIEGVEYVPDLKKLYTSNWHEDKIAVIDVATLQVIKKIPTESKPDGSAYAAPFHKLYVSDELAKAVAIVDVTRDEIVKTLRFDGETGMPQYDPVGKKIYVNLQDQNILAVIDPANDSVVGMNPVGKCKGNHGMALDPEHRRAFLSCEGNSLLTVFDLEKNEPIAYLPLADGADVVKFDPGLNRIYVACYSGAISVFEQKDPGHYRKLGDVAVAHAVHSIAVDTVTHRLFAPEQEQDGVPVARLVIYEASGK
jgi:YVTN family beta-propeller protein